MVSVLTRIFGTQNLELAEDVVQETFIAAMQTWRIRGVPDNPSAWLFRSAKNKAIDIIRKNKFSVAVDFSDPERKLLQSEYTLTSVMNNIWKEDAIADDQLRMMFACCHEEIAVENQITLILKTLCGFTTTEIARAFVAWEDTISKRLYRSREFFREKKIRPEFPDASQLKNKIGAVLHSVYLIFNEGYNSTQSSSPIRKDLLEQALYLCELLCTNKQTQLPETYAAMALMCFHAARIDSRLTKEGEIILLSHQNRSLWNRHMILIGNEYMNKAASGTVISTYHLEAAIAYEHCVARSFEKTNWKKILSYYDLLAQIHPTATVMLNRISVIYKIKGGEETLNEIQQSPWLPEWERHYIFHSLMGDIYADSNKAIAKKHFEKSMTLTKSAAEKMLLRKKIGEL